MRSLIRWVGFTVATSATVGGAAALMYFPASSSAATKPSPAPSSTPDLVTPAVTTLTNQAQQLNTEIGAAQSELARLKDQLANEAATRYYRPSTTPVVSVSTSPSRQTTATRRTAPAKVLTVAAKRPATHTTTGASSTHATGGDDANESTQSSSSHRDD